MVRELVERAVEKWGVNNQLSVAKEELAELIAAVCKYSRYDSHDEAIGATKETVLGEVADVYVVLDIIAYVYNLTDEEIRDMIKAKSGRLERWLSTDKNISVTLGDRECILPDKPYIPRNPPKADAASCKECKNKKYPGTVCVTCYRAMATDGIAPFFVREV